MNKAYLLTICLLFASFTGCVGQTEEIERLNEEIEELKALLPYQPKTKDELRIAVDKWTANPGNGNYLYGHISAWDTSLITDMSYLFYDKQTFNDNISAWDVSSVTVMGSMFKGATSFNGNLSGWDVSSVTDMDSIFYGATSFNGNISAWDVSSVVYMQDMFNGATSFNGDISAWDVSSVTDMGAMFANAINFHQDISDWDVSSVTDMSGMFFVDSYMLNPAPTFNQDISVWDVSTSYILRCIAPYTAVIQQLFIQRAIQRTTTTAMAVATRGTLSHVCLPCSERLERANRSGSGMGSGSERQQCAWERMGKRVQAA